MQFESKTVRSRPGLTQEEALKSLQESKTFKPGTRIAAIRRRGDRWIADLLEPKLAEFPPAKDDSGSDDGGSSSDDAAPEFGGPEDSAEPDDGGDSPDEGEGDDEGSEKHELTEALTLLHSIADALGIAPPDAGLEGDPNDPGAGGPPGLDGPPPPHGAGGPPAPGAGPVVPGPTPVGAPAFSSVNHEAKCATCQDIAGKTRTMTASMHDPEGLVKAAGAVADLEATYGPHGYKVAQLTRDGEYVRALLRRS